jgi:hypothetical protein
MAGYYKTSKCQSKVPAVSHNVFGPVLSDKAVFVFTLSEMACGRYQVLEICIS